MSFGFARYAACAAFAVAGIALATPSFAQSAAPSVQKQCGDKWQAAKAANQTGDQTWPQFLAKCRVDLAQPAAAPAAAPKPAAAAPAAAPKPAAAAPAPKPAVVAPAAAGKLIFPSKIDPKYATEKRAIQKTCVDQYNANKAANNGGNGGMNWIQKGGGYWSACNKALKGA